MVFKWLDVPVHNSLLAILSPDSAIALSQVLSCERVCTRLYALSDRTCCLLLLFCGVRVSS